MGMRKVLVLSFAAVFAAAVVRAAETAPAGTRIRFASWNVGHFANGVRADSRIKAADIDRYLDAYVSFVRTVNADVVGIAEYNRFFDEAKTLPTRDSVFRDYRHKIEGFDTSHYNALFVRDGEVKGKTAVVYAKGSQNAHYVSTRMRIGGKSVVFVMTHLDPKDPGLRRAQMEQLIGDFKGESRLVVGGDFNVGNQSEYAPFVAAGFSLANDGSHPTWPSPGAWAKAVPREAVDNILARGFSISDFRVHPSPPLADHCLVSCVLELE